MTIKKAYDLYNAGLINKCELIAHLKKLTFSPCNAVAHEASEALYKYEV